jgi:hypothetical protein
MKLGTEQVLQKGKTKFKMLAGPEQHHSPSKEKD